MMALDRIHTLRIFAPLYIPRYRLILFEGIYGMSNVLVTKLSKSLMFTALFFTHTIKCVFYLPLTNTFREWTAVPHKNRRRERINEPVVWLFSLHYALKTLSKRTRTFQVIANTRQISESFSFGYFKFNKRMDRHELILVSAVLLTVPATGRLQTAPSNESDLAPHASAPPRLGVAVSLIAGPLQAT